VGVLSGIRGPCIFESAAELSDPLASIQDAEVRKNVSFMSSPH